MMMGWRLVASVPDTSGGGLFCHAGQTGCRLYILFIGIKYAVFKCNARLR